MYIPKINKWDDEEAIFRFLHENPFALIVSHGTEGLSGTHLPVEIEPGADGETVIRTHMARANPQWKSFAEAGELMVVFGGPHTYISSSWYDHVNVPTWNYLAVHVYGKPRILDTAETIDVLNRLVSRYEQSSERPFSMSQMTEEDVHNHVKALVAFEISIDRIDAKAKLSQNRNAHNVALIKAALTARGDEQSLAIRDAMDEFVKK